MEADARGRVGASNSRPSATSGTAEPTPNWATSCPACGEWWGFEMTPELLNATSRDGLSDDGRAFIALLGVCGECRGAEPDGVSVWVLP